MFHLLSKETHEEENTEEETAVESGENDTTEHGKYLPKNYKTSSRYLHLSNSTLPMLLMIPNAI